MRRLMLICFVLLIVAPAAMATGFMVPGDRRLAGLDLESHRVSVEINDQSAVTRVVEVFRNQHRRELEAIFVFPLPKGAAVSDFKMYVNGRLVTGEIMEAGKARGIYEQIVRQMRDPGLLEYVDSNLLKLRVYPVPAGGKQEVTVEYSQALDADGGLVEYVYPLRTPQGAAKTLQDFTLNVEIQSRVAIANIYSPTHDVAIRRIDDHHATAGFEKSKAMLDRNFQLFYALSDKQFGASLISSGLRGKDGYFLLLLSPRVDVKPGDIAAKDVVFAVDVSGSMQGDKIAQAKKALEFCVSALNAQDRFRIITFSNAVEGMSRDLLDASPENLRKARDFLNRLEAGGGTDIDSALQAALDGACGRERPYIIVFLTDGLPTVGETDAGKILKGVERRDTSSTRIFCFGVGYDVNAVLLDKLARTSSASSQYIEPGEDIEVKVSSFFAKIGEPLLSGVEIDFGGAGARDVYPAKPGDLFKGSQLVIAGRYRRPGTATITLKGTGGSGERAFEYNVDFAADSREGEYVSNIWAGRKIAFLLDQIRLHGENKELKDEVIRLSKEYGIMTPYTSYLVTEGSPVVRRTPMPIRRRLMRLQESAGEMDLSRAGDAGVSEQEAQRFTSLGYSGVGEASSGGGGGPLVHGKVAVKASAANSALLRAAQADQGRLVRQAAGRNFANIAGTWVDENVSEGLEVVKVKFASEAYFEVFNNAVPLQKAFTLGQNIVLQIGKYCLVVDEEGIESAKDAAVQTLIKAAQKL